MTTLLAIETATQSCSAALLHDGQVTERFEIAPRQHTDLILPMIESLLSERSVQRADINAIAFGAGPGSFMGTRLAVGVAQGLAYALGIPVIPVSTLQILAQTAFEEKGCERVMPGWDARMGEVYWGSYQLDNGVMQPLQADKLSKPEAVIIDTTSTLVGNSWPLYWQQDYIDIYPHGSALISLALPLLNAGQTHSPLNIEPVYLRDKVTHN
jgi:tRNA threonylcarbamoyladenosine biosynthesis protein TsaB